MIYSMYDWNESRHLKVLRQRIQRSVQEVARSKIKRRLVLRKLEIGKDPLSGIYLRPVSGMP
jgi:hypothetical protein